MAVRSLAQSTLRQNPQLNSMLAGYQPNAFHHLETVRLGGTAASIDFTNLSRYSDYQHFQVRACYRINESVGYPLTEIWFRFNGVQTNSYSFHSLYGNASSVTSFNGTSSNRGMIGRTAANSSTSGAFAAAVIDILDPFDTSKNTTLRSLSGISQTGGGLGDLSAIHLFSAAFLSTDAITSISFLPNSQNWVAGSRFSLYGIKARA